MALSRSELAELTCPTCGREFQGEVWLVIDRAERPDLVGRLLDGKLDATTCPHCHAEGAVSHPLLFHDAARESVLCALPLSVRGPEAARQLVGDLLQGLHQSLAPEQRLPYLAEVELVPELDGLRAWLIEQSLGEDKAFEERLLADAIGELLNVAGQHDFQRVIARQRRLLLTQEAEEALEGIFEQARSTQDRELQRRAREARAILGRMRSIVGSRRRALAGLLDDLAPQSEAEVAVAPHLRQMLDAVDPQEVYAARIELAPGEQELLDRLLERLGERAEAVGETEALAFVRNLQALPRQ